MSGVRITNNLIGTTFRDGRDRGFLCIKPKFQLIGFELRFDKMKIEVASMRMFGEMVEVPA
jgi:hypothetical protein